MDKYYINISNKEEFDIGVKQLESLGYKEDEKYSYNYHKHIKRLKTVSDDIYCLCRYNGKEDDRLYEGFKELPLLEVGNLVTIGDCKTVYKIETISGGNMARIVNLKTRNRYDYKLDKLKLYTGETTEDKFKLGDIVKVIDVGYMASTFDEAAKAMGLTKWVRSNRVYSNEQKETILKYNYYKVIGSYKYDSELYIGIENCVDGNQYVISEVGIEHTSLVKHTGNGCIDYPISYVDTSQVSVNNKGEKTLLTNNNTMEKLNELRANKFFANEKNLVAIETLDTLLKDSIDLVVATKEELDRVQSKLIGLNRKLESATNNQDVAMLKDLIASTKVVQEFVDELKGKTISKFETAKTKFDVAGYLKD